MINGKFFTNCWCKHQVWKFLHAGCSQYPDVQQVLIDSTITHAHACAAEAVGSSAEEVALLGDKDYDNGAFIQALTEKGIEPIIPPRSNRINP